MIVLKDKKKFPSTPREIFPTVLFYGKRLIFVFVLFWSGKKAEYGAFPVKLKPLVLSSSSRCSHSLLLLKRDQPRPRNGKGNALGEAAVTRFLPLLAAQEIS